MTAANGTRAGRISKPYGLKGEVIMILSPQVTHEIKEGITLFVGLAGQRIPFFVESAEVTGKDQAIIKFEFIGDPAEARKICDCEAYFDFDSGYHTEETQDHASLLGYTVIDSAAGPLGIISDFLDSDMNPTWIISKGKREFMVPATEDYIISINHISKELHLKLPPGLTDL